MLVQGRRVAILLTITWLAVLSNAMNYLTCDMMKDKGPIIQMTDSGNAYWLKSLQKVDEDVWGGSYFPINHTTVMVGDAKTRFSSTHAHWTVVDLMTGAKMIEFRHNFTMNDNYLKRSLFVDGNMVINVPRVFTGTFFTINLTTGSVDKKWQSNINETYSEPSLSLINGIPHIIGGRDNGTLPLLYYDAVHETWRENNTIMVGGKLRSSIVQDGMLLVCGGKLIEDEYFIRTCTRFNISTGAIVDQIDIPCGKIVYPKMFMMNNTVYTAGVCPGSGNLICVSGVYPPTQCRTISTESESLAAYFEIFNQCPDSFEDEETETTRSQDVFASTGLEPFVTSRSKQLATGGSKTLMIGIVGIIITLALLAVVLFLVCRHKMKSVKPNEPKNSSNVKDQMRGRNESGVTIRNEPKRGKPTLAEVKVSMIYLAMLKDTVMHRISKVLKIRQK